MKKNIIIVVLSLIIICGIIVIGMSRLDSNTQEIISNAINSTSKLKSFEAELITYSEHKRENGEISAMTIKSELICFSEPYRSYINMSVFNETDGFSTNYERYAVYDGEKFIIYTYDSISENWNVADRYNKEHFPLHGGENTIKEDIVFYLKNADRFKKDGEEKIKGYDTVKYIGTFVGYSLRNLYKNMGYSDNIIDSVLAKNKSLDISIWIDAKSYNVVKYSMDVAHIYQYIHEMLNSEIKQSVPLAEISWEKYQNEIIIFNFDKAPEFEVPKDALEALKEQSDDSN